MEFRDVARRVIDLYGEGSYDDGLEVIARARPDHLDKDGTLTFWQACLLGVSGRSTEAMEILEEGLERGLWWGSGALADRDLDSLRSLPGWQELAARSDRAVASAAQLRPGPRVRAAEMPTGTLVTLHGAGADPATHAAEWERATPDSWTVITPAGDVPLASGEWAWRYDLSPSPLAEYLEQTRLEPPLVLAGWSQGGGMAASIAWSGDLEVDGLLLFGPGIRIDWNPDVHRHIPTLIVIGENDLNLPSCLKLRDRMREVGVAVQVEVLQGRGHERPDDLGQAIADGLEWLIQR